MPDGTPWKLNVTAGGTITVSSGTPLQFNIYDPGPFVTNGGGGGSLVVFATNSGSSNYRWLSMLGSIATLSSKYEHGTHPYVTFWRSAPGRFAIYSHPLAQFITQHKTNGGLYTVAQSGGASAILDFIIDPEPPEALIKGNFSVPGNPSNLNLTTTFANYYTFTASREVWLVATTVH
jgi:hypothetical protein